MRISCIVAAWVMALMSGLGASPALAQTVIEGVGSYFSQPLYQVWGDTYTATARFNLESRYTAIGSSAGKRAFITNSLVPGTSVPLSYAGTTLPLNSSDLSTYETNRAASGDPVQVPLAAGAIVFAYNPEGLNLPNGALRLSRATYCGIADGVIRYWNHSAITKDNGQIPVSTNPNFQIRFVRRADTSGETLNLSTHLKTVCTGSNSFPSPYNQSPYPSDLKWDRGAGPTAEPVGTSDSNQSTVNWPDAYKAAQGDAGVLQLVRNQVGAMGYVGSAYTKLAPDNPTSLPVARLQNQDNLLAIATTGAGPQYITGTTSATSKVLGSLTLGTPFAGYPFVRAVNLNSYINPVQPGAYPIIALVYGLFYELYNDEETANQCECLVDWALQEYPDPQFYPNPDPDPVAINRGFSPLPAGLKEEARLTAHEAIYVPSQVAFRTTLSGSNTFLPVRLLAPTPASRPRRSPGTRLGYGSKCQDE